jgi:hypothetical protein
MSGASEPSGLAVPVTASLVAEGAFDQRLVCAPMPTQPGGPRDPLDVAVASSGSGVRGSGDGPERSFWHTLQIAVRCEHISASRRPGGLVPLRAVSATRMRNIDLDRLRTSRRQLLLEVLRPVDGAVGLV